MSQINTGINKVVCLNQRFHSEQQLFLSLLLKLIIVEVCVSVETIFGDTFFTLLYQHIHKVLQWTLSPIEFKKFETFIPTTTYIKDCKLWIGRSMTSSFIMLYIWSFGINLTNRWKIIWDDECTYSEFCLAEWQTYSTLYPPFIFLHEFCYKLSNALFYFHHSFYTARCMHSNVLHMHW